MSRTAVIITLDTSEQELLQKLHRRRNLPDYQKERIQIVLAANNGLKNKDIATQFHLEVHRIGVWRKRWAKQHHDWRHTDESLRPPMNERLVLHWLADQKGRGRHKSIVAEQRAKVAALSLEPPEQNGLPFSHWTLEQLAKMSVQRGIVTRISPSTVYRILKKTTCRRIGGEVG